MVRIALDLEGVCSDTLGATNEVSDKLGPEYNDNWGWPTEELYQEFLDVSQDIWENNPLLVEPLEPDIATYVDQLREEHEVHLVTNRYGCDIEIEAWLANQGITVDGFQSNEPGTAKGELDYDIYIDDNPAMIGEDNGGHLFVVHQRYNDDFELGENETRVRSLEEVVEILVDPDEESQRERVKN